MGIQETYTIKETSQLSGLPESTLRYYEAIGIISPIERDASSKHRMYNQDDVNVIDAVACLNATGMSIEDMRLYLQNRDKGAAGADAEIELLTTQARRIDSEEKQIALRKRYIKTKISYWQAVKAGDRDKAKVIAKTARAIASDMKFPNQ